MEPIVETGTHNVLWEVKVKLKKEVYIAFMAAAKEHKVDRNRWIEDLIKKELTRLETTA